MGRRIRLSSVAALIFVTASFVTCGEENERLRRGDDPLSPTTGGQAGDPTGGNATGSGSAGSSSVTTGTGSGGASGSGGSSSDPSGAGGSIGGSAGAGDAGHGGNASGGNGGAAGSGGATGSKGGTAGSGGAGGGTGGAAGMNSGGAGTGGVDAGGDGGGGSAGGSGGSSDAGTPDALHFVVYGDTRSGSATHQNVIDQIAKLNPQLVIHSGDLWDGYTQATFASILTKNANIANLLTNGFYVVSRGNHETVADFLAFKPSLSRGNASELFSYTVGNSFFVVLGMDPSKAAAFLEGELKKPESMAARWRFVQSHYSIYSGGTTHGANGVPAIEKLCDTYHVTAYWSGHDHIYERSHQVFGGQVVDKGDDLSTSNGTVYVVSGGGGAPLYGVAPLATSHFQMSTNNYVDVVAATNTVTVKAYKLDGSVIDSFVISQ